jgi:hypothetical protein
MRYQPLALSPSYPICKPFDAEHASAGRVRGGAPHNGPNPRQSLDFRGRQSSVWPENWRVGWPRGSSRAWGVLLGLQVTKFGISACFHSPGLSFASYDPCSEQRHDQVHAEATLRCAGLLRAQVAPRQEMPNLADFFSVILCFWRWLFTLLGGG